MFIHNEIRKNLSLFSDICKNHGIKSLYAFGSSVTDQFNPQRSDIDLLVEMEDMDPLEKGEALNQYDKQPERISLNNTRQIVGFRNRIIHAYDSLDDTLVWAIVVNHLPALKSEVKTLLENC